MRAQICEKTFDLYMYITPEDAKELDKKLPDILTAEDKGYHFWLRKGDYIKSFEGIWIQVPDESKMLKVEAWHIGITGDAYQRLKLEKQIGTRYHVTPDFSRLTLILEE